MKTHLHPNAIYEVLIPISSLQTYENYQLTAKQLSANTTVADSEEKREVIPVIKRKIKEVQIDDEETSMDVQFQTKKKLFRKSLKGLHDNRSLSTFSINSEGKYENDSEGRLYEIYGSEYLVFQVSMLKRIYDDDSLIEVILSVESRNEGYFSHFLFKKLNMALLFFYAYLSQAGMQYLLSKTNSDNMALNLNRMRDFNRVRQIQRRINLSQ